MGPVFVPPDDLSAVVIVESVNAADRAYWTQALGDSGLTEADAKLFFFDRSPHAHPASAEVFAPGQRVSPTWPPLSDADRREASAASNSFTITVDRDARDPVLVWALVRHELEHCRQFKHYGRALSQLGQVLDETIIRVYGSQPGVYTLYNLIPTESDANRAASAFARRAFGSAACEALSGSDWAILIEDAPPPDLSTVGFRQGCFAALNAEHLRSSPHIGPLGIDPLLRAIAPELVPEWPRVASDHRVRALVDEARRVVPSWEKSKALTLEAFERAVGLARNPD